MWGRDARTGGREVEQGGEGREWRRTSGAAGRGDARPRHDGRHGPGLTLPTVRGALSLGHGRGWSGAARGTEGEGGRRRGREKKEGERRQAGREARGRGARAPGGGEVDPELPFAAGRAGPANEDDGVEDARPNEGGRRPTRPANGDARDTPLAGLPLPAAGGEPTASAPDGTTTDADDDADDDAPATASDGSAGRPAGRTGSADGGAPGLLAAAGPSRQASPQTPPTTARPLALGSPPEANAANIDARGRGGGAGGEKGAAASPAPVCSAPPCLASATARRRLWSASRLVARQRGPRPDPSLGLGAPAPPRLPSLVPSPHGCVEGGAHEAPRECVSTGARAKASFATLPTLVCPSCLLARFPFPPPPLPLGSPERETQGLGCLAVRPAASPSRGRGRGVEAATELKTATARPQAVSCPRSASISPGSLRSCHTGTA